MVLKLSLVLDRPSYRPGNLLGAIIEVANVQIGDDEEVSVELAGLEVMCEGSEYVDPSWVSPSYHADLPPLSSTGRRRAERHIFHVAVTRTPNTILTTSSKRRFHVSMRLPENLPPSFRGTAVRFNYHMRVKAKEVAPPDSIGSVHVHGPESPSRPSPFFPEAQPGPSSEDASSSRANGNNGPGVPNGNGGAAEAGSISNEGGVELPPHIVKVPFIVWPSKPKRRGSFDPCNYYSLPRDFFGESEVAVLDYKVGMGMQNCSFHVTEMSQEDPQFNTALSEVPRRAAEPPQRTTSEQSMKDGAPSEVSGKDDDPDDSSATRLHSHLALDSYSTTPGTTVHHQQTSLRSYNLKIGDSPLVKFSLHSSQEGPIHPGSTLSGMLDFQCSHVGGPGPQPRCVQVAVLLETEECLNPGWTASHTKMATESSSGLPTIRKVYDEHMELTQDTLLTHFMFTIPADAPASFATPLVALRWVLRFELIAMYMSTREDGRRELGRQKQETLSWVLPVLVYPPSLGYK